MQPMNFLFKSHSVRVVIGKDDEPWFVASDVASILGYRNAPDMTRMLDADEAATHNLRSRSENGVEQAREVTVISESGLYAAILKSRRPEANRFRKWITSEVIPAIRKTGRYEAEPSQADEPATFDDEMPVVQRSEQLVSGARIFNAILRVGRQLRLSQSRAAVTANMVALRHTGVDVLREMSVFPEELQAAAELTIAGGEADQLADRVKTWLADSPAPNVTSGEIIAGLGLAVESHERKAAETRIGILMSRLGWKRREQRGNYLRRHIYLRPTA